MDIVRGGCAPSLNRLVATVGVVVACHSGAWTLVPPSHLERGPGLGFKPRGELCCSPALMAGMFSYSNQNKGLNLPCRSSGTGTIYVVGRSTCRLSSQWL